MGVLLVCWHRGDGHPGSIQAPSWLLSPGLVSCFGSGVQFGGGAGARGGTHVARMVSSGVHGGVFVFMENLKCL